MNYRSLIGIESAVVIWVPVADQPVESARSLCLTSTSSQIAAHITINYPFIVQNDNLDSIVARLSESVKEFGRFEFRLTELRRWPTTLYLRPEPETVFRAIIAAVWRAFPESPPYGGRFDDVIPHLTIIESSEIAELDNLESDLRTELERRLPIQACAEELHLIAKFGSEWSRVARVSL